MNKEGGLKILEKYNTRTNRMVALIILGIIFAVITCSIAITLGYHHVKSHELADYRVNVLGISIYQIQNINGELKGIGNHPAMMFIGIIFSMVLTIVMELIIVLKNKKNEGKSND
ncbi:hypothetical protein FACS1894193_08650 [Bacilli bacterium]|nr:hypothetical protein FACS1894192_00300 [Bacilli bacterium]GHU42766.1 hypothetical protein FACS1894193_08650 [Bacilli bacterium]